MRKILAFIILISATSLKAQTFLPLNSIDYLHRTAFTSQDDFKDSIAKKKWFLTTYTGFSTSFIFYKGGNATIFSVPLSLQLNRRLNNNVYAFAGVSAAPAYINFNQAFLNTNINKRASGNNFLKSGNFNMYSSVDLGLTYVNDAKTFSISGSIGIERSTYPAFQYNPVNTTNKNPVIYQNNYSDRQ